MKRSRNWSAPLRKPPMSSHLVEILNVSAGVCTYITPRKSS
jgi:hypothetical protein